MDEMTVLREAFAPEPAPDPQARDRARAALLVHMQGTRTRPAVTPRRWPARMAMLAAAAVVAVVGLVAVENVGGDAGGLPYPRPASAAEVLQNAAWAAARKPWHDPRPDQFMYNETSELRNEAAYEREHPNDPLVPGRTRTLIGQSWKRIDGRVMARVEDGQLRVYDQGGPESWGQVPYADLRALTTPEKVLAWDRADKDLGVDLDRLLGQYVLPPDVEAAVFRALSRGEHVTLQPDAVNLDGRPAIGLGRTIEGYLSQQLLFDPQTYTLIGEREVVIADHSGVDEFGRTWSVRPGAVYRQVIYTKAVIVEHPGDTE